MRTTTMNGTATIRQILHGLCHRLLMRMDCNLTFLKIDNVRFMQLATGCCDHGTKRPKPKRGI